MAVLLFLLGLVILSEALNKLDRTRPCRRGLCHRQRALEWLKALAWALLAIGAGGAIVGPIFHDDPPTYREACMFAGFVVLIIRTRIKEG